VVLSLFGSTTTILPVLVISLVDYYGVTVVRCCCWLYDYHFVTMHSLPFGDYVVCIVLRLHCWYTTDDTFIRWPFHIVLHLFTLTTLFIHLFIPTTVTFPMIIATSIFDLFLIIPHSTWPLRDTGVCWCDPLPVFCLLLMIVRYCCSVILPTRYDTFIRYRCSFHPTLFYTILVRVPCCLPHLTTFFLPFLMTVTMHLPLIH